MPSLSLTFTLMNANIFFIFFLSYKLFNREVEVKDYSFVVFRAFLQYIYTDTVNVSPEDAIGKLETNVNLCYSFM